MEGSGGIQAETAAALRAVAGAWPTPAYVYDLGHVLRRIDALRAAFGDRLEISYALKANPNRALIEAMAPRLQGFDVSSLAEAERAIEAGRGRPISFTGPGKRDAELLRFATLGAGYVVLESVDEAESLSELVRRYGLKPQPALLRINPLRVPRQFGASMSSRTSQFGVDEEVVGHAVAAMSALEGVSLVGFHCYPATNGLNAQAVADNLSAMAGFFRRCAAETGLRPRILIFGAGFGVPYFDGEDGLDLEAVASGVNPVLDVLRGEPAFAQTRLVLELGRWIVGPAGYLLTSVVRTKSSRGKEIRVCDAGFNAHMAACGMLGGTFRRNWRIVNLTNPDGPPETCDLVGPLCTTLDHVATDIVLPQVRKGDVLAILQSGAYGLTASPTRFIGHPEPAELLLKDGVAIDVSEGPAKGRTEAAAAFA